MAKVGTVGVVTAVQPQVVVTTDNGQLRYIEKIVAAALVLLEVEMTRLNI